MKKFQFTLEALLHLRREKERLCEIALAKSVGKLKLIDDDILAAKDRGNAVFTQKMSTLDDLRLRERIWLKSINDQKRLATARAEALPQFEEDRKKYTEAHTQRYALDKLKAKQHERWKKTCTREEIARLDEAGKGMIKRQSLLEESL
ncbi:MAG: hypothetical protein B0D92_05985 [Spirochaeta sp. LUC14_002_19_P3]|nr:MAG: hypothetical protein B0D92_05985 [Spirochaeta sp. LUC14_002_19_P3]